MYNLVFFNGNTSCKSGKEWFFFIFTGFPSNTDAQSRPRTRTFQGDGHWTQKRI